MASQTGAIIQYSLDALLEDLSFLPNLHDQARQQAFTSLAAILSTPNHIHQSFLRIPLESGKVVRFLPFVFSIMIRWDPTKEEFASMNR